MFEHVGQMKDMTCRAIESLDKDEETGIWGPDKIVAKKAKKMDLERLLIIENCIACQKSKTCWVRERDANTRYFHRLLSIRQNKNHIARLEIEEGRFVENEEDIAREMVAFFAKLYSSDVEDRWEIESIDWHSIS